EGIIGFSIRDGGRWSGLDVDFCRAVAAAALGSPERVAFVELTAPARFPALQRGTIDLLARHTTWTLGREAGLHTHFAGTLYYEQELAVLTGAGAKSATHLKGATVCVVKDTTHEESLLEYFTARKLSVTPLLVDSRAAGAAAFLAGRCHAFTAEATFLAGVNL